MSATPETTKNTLTCYASSYSTPDGAGGISTVALDLDSGQVSFTGSVARAGNVGYLALADNGILYAALENGDGEVAAFIADGISALRPLGSGRTTGGANPCHISVHPSGRYVLSANYGSGSIAVHPILTDGSLGEPTDVMPHYGSGLHSGTGGRQAEPHPHMVVTSPAAAPTPGLILAADLGTDSIFRYALDVQTGRLHPEDEIPMLPGTGPRHLVVHKSFLYVAGELDSTLSVIDLRATRRPPQVVATVPTIPNRLSGPSFPSAIKLSPGGRFCYVANRGPDTLAVFALDGPEVRLEATVPCGGENPRDLELCPFGPYLYVANQASGNVSTFRINMTSGVPVPTGESLSCASPSCFVSH